MPPTEPTPAPEQPKSQPEVGPTPPAPSTIIMPTGSGPAPDAAAPVAPTTDMPPAVAAAVAPVTPAGETPAAPTASPEPGATIPPAAVAPTAPWVATSPMMGGLPSAGEPIAKPKGKGMMIASIIGVVVIVLAAAGAGYWFLLRPPSPQQALRDAVERGLSTLSVTQQTSDTSNSTGTIQYDVSNVKAPKIYSTVSANESGDITAFDGYGTLSNTYVKFDKVTGFPSNQLGQWVQIKKSGTTPDDAALSLDALYDPTTLVFGQFIFGNFSASTRNQLTNYAIKQNIYKYDPKAVTRTTINSQAVYKYSITIDDTKLTAYNEQVAAAMGLTKQNADDALTLLDTASSTDVIYITIKNPHLVRAVETDGSTVTTNNYTNLNATKLPSEPTAKIQWDDYAKQLEDDQDFSDGVTYDQTTNASDITRETDIRDLQTQLETYFAYNDNYPTLANLNDPAWVKANFQDFDSASLKDPNGKTATIAAKPAANVYSYQYGADNTLATCNNTSTPCDYFLLTATLTDGTTFTKESAN